tara:strand:+ start:2340 stop:2708 length:369 start_codon:yes stop_codon:yes gene_type:complete
MLFSSFEEMQLVIYSLIKQNKLKSKNLEIALKATSVYPDDKNKIFRVWQTLEKELWSIPEAVEKGFHSYIEERKKEILQAFEYHNANCKSKCKLCEVLICVKEKETSELLGKKPKNQITSIA